MTESFSKLDTLNRKGPESSYDSNLTINITKESKKTELSISEGIKYYHVIKVHNALSLIMPTKLIISICTYAINDSTIDEYSDGTTIKLEKTIKRKIPFIHDPTIYEYSNRIKNELGKFIKRRITFDLSDPAFMSNLLELIRDNEEKIPSFHGFWYDLERFLFKYALLMRKRFPHYNDLFEGLVKNVKDIMIIINVKTNLPCPPEINDKLRLWLILIFPYF